MASTYKSPLPLIVLHQHTDTNKHCTRTAQAFVVGVPLVCKVLTSLPAVGGEGLQGKAGPQGGGQGRKR